MLLLARCDPVTMPLWHLHRCARISFEGFVSSSPVEPTESFHVPFPGVATTTFHSYSARARVQALQSLWFTANEGEARVQVCTGCVPASGSILSVA